MRITTRKVGGIWHGYLEGHPEIDERALTEEIARQKVERILDTWLGGHAPDVPEDVVAHGLLDCATGVRHDDAAAEGVGMVVVRRLKQSLHISGLGAGVGSNPCA